MNLDDKMQETKLITYSSKIFFPNTLFSNVENHIFIELTQNKKCYPPREKYSQEQYHSKQCHIHSSEGYNVDILFESYNSTLLIIIKLEILFSNYFIYLYFLLQLLLLYICQNKTDLLTMIFASKITWE